MDILSEFGMNVIDKKLRIHSADMRVFLQKAKQDFDKNWETDLEPNADIEQFEMQQTLGVGSFGRVVLVKHLATGKKYAMKYMEKRTLVNLNQVEHVLNELKVAAAVNSAFVVNMCHFAHDNVYLFAIMPYQEGGELFMYLRRLHHFEEMTARFYCGQVVLALEYLHHMGVVYRDLKPENLLLDSAGYLRVGDLGFCKRILQGRTYTLCGTPEYIAPEMILHRGYGTAVDWWSLGVLLYEMVAGYTPFYCSSALRIYEKIVAGRYTCPIHFSIRLQQLLSHLLQVNPMRRMGALRHGVSDLKSHEWFRPLDWGALFSRKLAPPIVPTSPTKERPAVNFERRNEGSETNRAEVLEPLRHSDFNEFGNLFPRAIPPPGIERSNNSVSSAPKENHTAVAMIWPCFSMHETASVAI